MSKNKSNNSPPWRGAAFAAGRVFLIRHPEASLYEAVRISSFSFLSSPLVGEGTLTRHYEERSDVAIS